MQKTAKKAQIDGFRPGKVPVKVIEDRFGQSILADIAGRLADEAFQAFVKDAKVRLAGQPVLAEPKLELGKPVTLSVAYEVYPEITLNTLKDKEVTVPMAEVGDEDITVMVDRIRAKQSDWVVVERAVQDKDQVLIDFKGFLDGEAFEGGEAEGFHLEMGAGNMIPGFEEGILGMKADEEKDIAVTFPEAYHAANLAGKAATFKIKVHEVKEAELPALDDAFVEKMGVKGGVEGLKEEVRKQLERELAQAMETETKKVVLDALVAANPIEVPEALIDAEVEYLQNVTRHQVAQQQGLKEAPKMDLPKEPFFEEAKKRVLVGLLMAEVIKEHKIKADAALLNKRIERMASSYEDPSVYEDWMRGNKDMMSQLETEVLEQQVVDKLLEDATIKSKAIGADDLIKAAKGA